MLSASVAPEVKMSSCGLTLKKLAIESRERPQELAGLLAVKMDAGGVVGAIVLAHGV